jgi:ankyrin repeat protein
LNEDDESIIIKYGVIVAFTNGIPTFLHQSFAEFFVAKSSLDKIKAQKGHDSELEQIFREMRHFLIRKFLNDLMQQQPQRQVENNSLISSEKKLNQEYLNIEDFKTEIENCCRENLLYLLKYFVEDQGAPLATKNEFLIVASENGITDIVVYLLEKGIDVNQQNIVGDNALMWASMIGHKKIVQTLLQQKNIKIYLQNTKGNSALIWASQQGHIEIVQMLLQDINTWIDYLKRENKSRYFDQIKTYYMPRKLRRHIKIDRKKIEQRKDGFNIGKKEDDFLIVHTEEEFNEKFSQNPPEIKNIHYLIQNQNHFVWKKSSGGISALKKYLLINEECEDSIEEAAFFHKNNDKVLIISAEPGMGKSFILDHLTQQSTADNFFLKIILNTCKETLSSTNFKENLPKDLKEFVLKSLLNKNDQQEISLLTHLAKEEKLTLMFDGLDEVNDYKEQVIHIIDELNKDKRIKKILITTRNHLREELEDHFKIIAYNLSNFDEYDQKNFLYNYWHNLNKKNQKRASSAQLKQSAEDLIKRIKSISSLSLNQLIGIPLQTKMLADIYFEKVKDEKEFSQIILTNIADLYNQFIESKIEIQFERTNNNTKIASLSRKFKEYLESDKINFYSDHIKLSSLILFEHNNQNDIGLELHEQVELHVLEYGVIVAFTNGIPTFLHQSFAQYFLTKSSLLKIKEQNTRDDKELEQILRDERHFLIRKFLNDLMEKEEQQHQQVENNNEREDFQKEIENCCRENLLYLLKYFIEQKGANLKTKNEFLIEASRSGYKDIVAFLLEKGIDVNQQDKDGHTALMWASEQDHKEIVQMLEAKEKETKNE